MSKRAPARPTAAERAQAGLDADAAGSSRFGWLLVFLTLFGALLRAVQLDGTFAFDEVETVRRFVEGAPAAIFADYGGYGSTNNHVLNSLLAFVSVRAFGLEEWALRLPSFVFGVLAIPLAGLVALRLFGDRLLAGVATLLFVLSPIQVSYAPACRGYGLLVFFTLLSAWLFLRVLDEGRRGESLLLFASLCAAGWSHMSALIFVGTLGFTAVVLMAFAYRAGEPVWGSPARLPWALGAVVLAGLALMLWYSRGSLILQDVQSRITRGEFVDPSLAGLQSVHGGMDPLPWVEHTGKKFFGTSGPFLLVSVPVLLLGIPLVWRRDKRRAAVLLCAVFFPPAALLAGRLMPFPRYFLFVQPFLLMLSAAALCWLGTMFRRWRPGPAPRGPLFATAAVTAAFLGISLPMLWQTLSGPGTKLMGIEWDVKAATEYVAAEMGPDDVVVAFPRPRERGEWRLWSFPQTFAFHEKLHLAPRLNASLRRAAPRRTLWYVTPQRAIGAGEPVPPGWEPELAATFDGVFVYRGELADGKLRPIELPPFDLGERPARARGAWSFRRIFEASSLATQKESGAQDQVTFVAEESGVESEVFTRLPVASGALLELWTEVSSEASDGLRPFGRVGFHFYDEAGERIASVSRDASPWEGLRPHAGWSELGLLTVAPSDAHTMEPFVALAVGNHAGDTVRFRLPELRGP